MSAKHDELLALEREFWTGDSAFFRKNADKECLVAFTEMARVMNNAELAETAKNPHHWKELDIDLKGRIEPRDGIVLQTYEVNAVRSNGEPYRALVSSGYMKRNGGWKMMFHAQTPLERRAP
jgi:hypothetical protein